MTLDGLQSAIVDKLEQDTWMAETGKVVKVINGLKGDVESGIQKAV